MEIIQRTARADSCGSVEMLVVIGLSKSPIESRGKIALFNDLCMEIAHSIWPICIFSKEPNSFVHLKFSDFFETRAFRSLTVSSHFLAMSRLHWSDEIYTSNTFREMFLIKILWFLCFHHLKFYSQDAGLRFSFNCNVHKPIPADFDCTKRRLPVIDISSN